MNLTCHFRCVNYVELAFSNATGSKTESGHPMLGAYEIDIQLDEIGGSDNTTCHKYPQNEPVGDDGAVTI